MDTTTHGGEIKVCRKISRDGYYVDAEFYAYLDSMAPSKGELVLTSWFAVTDSENSHCWMTRGDLDIKDSVPAEATAVARAAFALWDALQKG